MTPGSDESLAMSEAWSELDRDYGLAVKDRKFRLWYRNHKKAFARSRRNSPPNPTPNQKISQMSQELARSIFYGDRDEYGGFHVPNRPYIVPMENIDIDNLKGEAKQ